MPQPDVTQAQAAIALLIAAGCNAADAVQWVRDAAAMVPEWADPATWLPDPGSFALTAVIDEAAVQDARADWYVHAPQEYKLLLDDLAPGAPEGVGLGEAVFFDPAQAPDADLYNERHYPPGSPRGGQFAPGSHATIGATGEVEPGGASVLGGEVADKDWITANVNVLAHSPAERAALIDTIAASEIPKRHFEGLYGFTTTTPQRYHIDDDGTWFVARTFMGTTTGQTLGLYNEHSRTIHIAPATVKSQATVIHELGHHVMNQKQDAPAQRMQDQLELRRRSLPHDLNSVGLRAYSLTPGGHELYADAFVVALKGSAAQQAALRQWLGEPWETFFREVFDAEEEGQGEEGAEGLLSEEADAA